MTYSCENSRVQQGLSKLLAEILLLKHEFLHRRNKVDEFVFSVSACAELIHLCHYFEPILPAIYLQVMF